MLYARRNKREIEKGNQEIQRPATGRHTFYDLRELDTVARARN